MKELLAVNGNLLFMENKDGMKEPVYEIIIITTEPRYELTNDTSLVRKRITEEFRFLVRDKHLDKFTAEVLEVRELKDTSQNSK